MRTTSLEGHSDESLKDSVESLKDSDERGRDSDKSPRDSNERGMLVNPNIFIDPHHQTPSTPTIPCPTRPSDLRKRPYWPKKTPIRPEKAPGGCVYGRFLNP